MFYYLTVIIIITGTINASSPIRVAVLIQNPFVYEDNNGSYAGVLIDLFEMIAHSLNITYEYHLAHDYGYVDAVTNRWHGLIGRLVDNQSDMAIAALTITADRSRVVRFSRPLLPARIVPLIKRPINGGQLPFSNWAELVDSQLLYGAVDRGSTYQLLQMAPNKTIYRTMGEYMTEKRDEVLARSYEEGAKRVQEGGYVFFGEEYPLSLLASRKPCNLMLMNMMTIASRSYAFAFNKDRIELANRFDDALVDYEWTIHSLVENHWEPQCTPPPLCVCARTDDHHHSSEESKQSIDDDEPSVEEILPIDTTTVHSIEPTIISLLGGWRSTTTVDSTGANVTLSTAESTIETQPHTTVDAIPVDDMTDPNTINQPVEITSLETIAATVPIEGDTTDLLNDTSTAHVSGPMSTLTADIESTTIVTEIPVIDSAPMSTLNADTDSAPMTTLTADIESAPMTTLNADIESTTIITEIPDIIDSPALTTSMKEIMDETTALVSTTITDDIINDDNLYTIDDQ